MKKSIFTLMFLAVMGFVSAQSLRFELNGEALTDGQTIYCMDYIEDFGEFIQELQLRNLTDTDLNVVVEKEEITVPEGSMNYFCWGLCFSPTVIVSPAYPLAAGSVSGPGDLAFHYMPASMDDFASIKYYAYDEREGVRISVVVVFNSLEGINDSSRPTISQPYPNPASSIVNFDYNMSGSNATAVVYNLVGQEVMRQEINTFDGKMSLSVADLNDGIYFCSVMRNGQTFATVKFVVKK